MKRVFFLFSFILWFSANEGFSTITMVDQQNPNNDGLFTSPAVDFGQSFVPILSSLDTADFVVSVPGPQSVTIALEIFTGTGLGLPILGISRPLTLGPASSPIPVEFHFTNPVILVPGMTYSMVVFVNSGSFAIQYGSDTYASGKMFDQRFIYPDRDLYFVEGLGVPEPGIVLMVLSGLAAIEAIRQVSCRSERT
jgi:hypothetical protein